MKKIVFVLVALLVCGFAIIACSPEGKKSKKNPINNTITVEVTPSAITGKITAANPTHALTAIVKDNGVIMPNTQVSWVVDPSDYGTFSPNPSSSTIFTAIITKIGTGTITASYNGMNSAPVQFSINEEALIIDSVSISPSAQQTISSTQTITFTAVAKAGTTTITTAQLNWTVTGPGSISPNPSNSGASVTFTPSGTGNATVKASCGAVNSSVVNVTISDSTSDDKLTFVLNGFTTEGGLNTIYGWGGAPAGAYTVADPWPQLSGYDGITRGIFDITWNSGWEGPTLVRPTALDASKYTKLVFYAKVPSGTGDIVARSLGNDAGASTSFIQKEFSLTTSWQKCEIDLPSNRTAVKGIICFVLATNEYSTGTAPNLPFTFYIDNVYFE